MRNIWNIAIWKTRWMLKQKSTWINMFILPIVFALIFGGIQSDEQTNEVDYLVKVGMVSEETDVDTELLQDIIGHQLNADIILFKNEEEAMKAMKNSSVSALVLWDDYFEADWATLNQTPWTFVYEKQTAQNFMLEQQMRQLIIGLNAIPMMGVDSTLTPKEQTEKWLHTWKDYRDSTIGVNIEYGQQEGSNAFSRVFVGFSLMFLMFTLNQSASTILEEKSVGTWNRMLLAPLNKLQLLLGNILHFLILGLTQFIVLMMFSSVVFKVSWGNYIDTLIFAVLIILTVSGLGFMIATLVKTKAQQNIVGSIVITVTSMLGGVYWPLSFVSETMRRIADFVPQKWAMDGLLLLMSGGYRLADITNTILILFIFLVVFYVIGFIRVRKI